MTLSANWGLVLFMLIIHEYVPYKCSLILIIGIVLLFTGFRHYCTIWTLYIIALIIIGGITFIVLYLACLSSYSIKYWMVYKNTGIALNIGILIIVTLILMLITEFINNMYSIILSTIWEYVPNLMSVTLYSMLGYMAILVALLSRVLFLPPTLLIVYMPIREL